MSGNFVEQRCGIKAPPRLSQLDGLRGLAACGVAFLYHPQSLFPAATLGSAPKILMWFQTWGWTLVDLFFLISGYIFAHVYLQGDGRLNRERLGIFMAARVARLYPLHLLTLGLCALLFWRDAGNTVLAFGSHLLMLQVFIQPVARTFDGPSWSISVEAVCYVLFALAACGGPRTLRRVSGLAVIAALLHFLLQGRPGGPWVGDSLPRGLLGFFLGQMLWYGRARLADVPTMLLACLFAFGLALDMGPLSSLLPLSLCAWPALLLLALRMNWMARAPLRWLGDRSYAIYLIHYPLLVLLERNWAPFGGGMGTVWAVTAAFAGAVLLISDLSYRLVEVPARRAIRAGWERRMAVAATVSANVA